MKDLFRQFIFLLSSLQKRRLAFLTLLILIGACLELAGIGLIIPVIMTLIDTDFAGQYPMISILVGKITEPTSENIIITGIFTLLLFYMFKTCYLAYMYYKQGVLIYNIKEEIASKLFFDYMHKHYSYYLLNNSAKVVRNLTAEIGNLGVVLRAAMVVIVDGIIVVAVIMVLMCVEPVATLAISLVIGLLAFVFQRSTKPHLIKHGKSRQYHEGMRIQHVQQGMSSLKEIKVLGCEQEFIDQFAKENTQGIIAERFQYILASMPRLFLEFAVVIGVTIVVFILVSGGTSRDQISLVLGIYTLAVFRVLPSVNRLLNAIQQLRFCFPSIHIIFNQLSLNKNNYASSSKKQDGARKRRNIVLKEKISVCDLSFFHNGSSDYILNDINLNICQGSCIGIMGKSGGGKSTLVDIILGLLEPTEGCVLIDGIDIRENISEWQKKIGYVPQNINLIDDTLRRNIAFGLADSEIDNASIDRAIDASHLRGVVNGLPRGIETFVGEHGVRLSGGQRQRIGIARALYHNPTVLILDEATSALDHKTELEVMKTVYDVRGDKTIIIVSHRINTLSDCDRVYHIEHGKIVN